MRIGFDAKRAFLNKSGLGNYSRDLIRSLHNYYPENDYFLFTPKPETNLLEPEYRKNIITPSGINKNFSSLWRSFKMGNDIEKCKMDIYHGLSNELPRNINKTKAAKIVTIHDLIFIKYPQLYKATDRLIYKIKFKNSCIEADKIIAISEQTKADIIRYFKIPENKISVIYQGCNPIFYEKVNKESLEKTKKKFSLPDNFILTVGTIEQRKNALNVVKALYYYNLDIPYVLIGRKTSYLKKILKYASEHNISKQIIIPENINNENLRDIYQLSSIFAYPSIYEGFGIPVLEAQNSGIPVITSEYGSTVEAAGKGALLVNPLDPKSIGSAIKELLENSETRKNLIDKAYENVKKFRQEEMSDKIIKLYESLN